MEKLLLSLRRAVYHYMDIVSPPAARWLARTLLGGERVEVSVEGSAFWIDPLSALGRELVARGAYEPEMTSIVDRYLAPGSVFVDVGANEGFFSVLASARIGSAGRVCAIEPQERCRQVLQRNLERNGCGNVTVVPLCVSDRAGTIALHLHPATNTGATSQFEAARSAIRTTQVECRTLEDILSGLGVTHVDLLKIDIEGGEFEAVMGSQALFHRGTVRRIALELHPEILRRRGVNPGILREFLQSAGYTDDEEFPGRVYVRN